MNVSRFAIRHPAVIVILMIALLFFGVIALATMNQEFIPNVALPEIVVITVYPGGNPEDVEREVTDVLEEELTTVSGLDHSRSVSSNSVSIIHLAFEDGTDLNEMLPEVRAKIDQSRGDLPDGVEGRPVAMIAGAELIPVFSFAVVSDRDPQLLTSFIEDSVIPPLTQISGISRVDFFGGEQEELFIELQLQELEARGISVLQVQQALSQANVSIPAGSSSYRGRDLHVRFSGEFETLQDVRDLPVGRREGEYIYLRDIAEVSIRYPDPEVYIDSDGKSTLVIDVMKRDEGNTPDIVREVRSLISGLDASYGEAVSFEILQDDTDLIRSSLMTVIRSGLMGMAMAILVMLIFLSDLRSTLIIASALPLSIVFAFIGMRAFGQSVNILSLSGLVVALGMVVDGSIVILENIYRHYNAGQDKVLASEQGTREVSQAVFASVSTTISVFVPLAALTGIIGIILSDLSLTLVFALLGSLVVSLITVPFFTSQLLKQKKPRRRKPLIDLLMGRLVRSYRRTLSWSLSRGGFLIFLAAAVFAATLLVLSMVGLSFIPSADTGEFFVQLSFPDGYSLEETRSRVLEAERIIRREVPELTNAVFFSGYADEYERSRPVKHEAYGKIILPPADSRERSVHQIIPALQYTLEEELHDADILVENGGFDKLMSIATQGSGFQIQLTSQNYELLKDTADEVAAVLGRDPEVYKAVHSAQRKRETAVGTLSLEELGQLGFTSFEAAVTSRILIHGEEVGTYRGGERDIPMVLGSTLNDMPLTDEVLEQIQLVDETGRSVSFGAFSSLSVEPSQADIERRDRMRTIVVTGYLHGEDLSGVSQRMRRNLEEMELPFGTEWSIGGITDLMERSIEQLLLLMAVSVFLVYAVMVIQFERFTQPLIIMVSIPFCLIGVVFGLLIFGSTLSIVAFLGIIALAGIVVNNAIVLIDYINMLRRDEKLELRQAVLTGAGKRLRPILMTTLTTFFGVLPLAFARGEGSEVYASLGQSIAGGLLTSTLITLFIVPVLYYLLERRKQRIEVLLEGEEP